MGVEGAAVVFGRAKLVSVLLFDGVKQVCSFMQRCSFAQTGLIDKKKHPPLPASHNGQTTYRLLGSWFFRDLAVFIGSNDFTISSDTGVLKELSVSSSFSWSDDDGDGFAVASSLALRRQHTAWGRTEGTRARGNDLARYLDDSETAILLERRGCRCSTKHNLVDGVQKLSAGTVTGRHV